MRDTNNAMPKWTEQLEWTAGQKSTAASGDGGGHNPEPDAAPQSGQGGPPGEEKEGPRIQLSNAVPDWQDQLDWSSADAASEAPHQDIADAMPPSAGQGSQPATDSILAYSEMAQVFNSEEEFPMPPIMVSLSNSDTAIPSPQAPLDSGATAGFALEQHPPGSDEIKARAVVRPEGSDEGAGEMQDDFGSTGDQAVYEEDESDSQEPSSPESKEAALRRERRKKAKEKRKRRR
jgi:hypothetical protein